MSKNQPKVSIGLPVYNGEKFIKSALDSLLSQTFEDFELIISDNASTDNTEEICRAYAAQDKRIRYYRNDTNLGCSRNFNRVFELSVGEYFKWAAYDDLHAPDFIMKCVAVLDNNPTVVLCHSHVSFIDENGDFLQNYNIQLNTDSQHPHKRFHELLTKHLCYQCYGVIRANSLRKVPPMGSYGTADGILLLRIGLLGEFYEITEYLFFARSHSEQSLSMFFPNHHLLTKDKSKSTSSILPDFYAYTVWFDSAKKGKILFPHWRILWEYMLSVWLFKLSLYQRIRCHISIYQQLQGSEYLLLKDLLKAAQIILWQRWRPSSIKETTFLPLKELL
ncbi:glycosyltransferase family 2 protein [Nodularia spumigena]|uniref:glycosyltransferase family 2 protein n=1 Tax=Nodularia spumigena TaxID=70799 RepID=UPI00232EAA8C|nr:glycosyltransferase family 2 protein [Nodularia spumigena]MDB9317237.1 glycosyltransferase family 2 protein [Nodularia spumigena CS-590/01A]MDB9321732.1 glycosyltransferase family 2 protein [Nodularia spumigena CS-591/07A]MDB9325216.1 glycosyltransferase family 2 protein [Nodularia spumigena CS-590/02]MDB9331265.1 glycosyltransferase family 2 protein [Nodularia spumigena CS-591/04]MDB9335704.1 glycosyltransferase family 2 protein [Nodularia spumigena CS-590/01]